MYEYYYGKKNTKCIFLYMEENILFSLSQLELNRSKYATCWYRMNVNVKKNQN